MNDNVKDYPPYLDYPKLRKPITNADHIRSMTDEELAKYLAWLEDEQACYQWEIYGDTDRISEWRDWLKSPMEEIDE